MISSLFSMFDPTVVHSTALLGLGKWVFVACPAFLFGWTIYIMPAGIGSSLLYLVGALKNVMSQNAHWKESRVRSAVLLLGSVFVLILFWNEIGLVPYGFGVTCHLVVDISLGMPLFIGAVVISLLDSGWKKVVSHMVPTGAPLGLSFVLVIIETVSFMVRPFTLSIRLMGNIVAGHLLVSLLCEISSALTINSIFAGWVVTLVGSGLLMFEMMVGVVQAVIFTILVFMYWTE